MDRHVCALLDAAVDLWAAANWYTYNSDEDNCTVQLYRWCSEVIRRDSRFALLTLQLQWVNLTPEMIEGLADVARAKRPDVRVQLGAAGRAVECKRLGVKAPWPRLYVRKGVARFVVGGYGQTEEVGFMVGYCQDGDPDVAVVKVNEQILLDPRLDATQLLETLTQRGSSLWSRSRHPRPSGRPIGIQHLLVRQQPA